MKRLLVTLLSASMLLSLTACGGGAAESTTAAPAATEAATTAAAAEAEEPTEAEAAAPADLSGDLVLYSSMTEGDLDALITCFNEVYPNINIEVVNGSAGELTSRLAAEAANPVGDVTWGGMSDSDGRVHEDIFEDWVSEHDAENADGFHSNNGLYSMDHVTTVVFCVNTDLEEELGVKIESYEDLLNPALKGQIVLSDPNSSSAAWNNLCNIMSVFGTDSDEAWDYIEQLMPNLVISGSSSVCFTSVQTGEYAVGMTYEDGAVTLLRDGATNIRLQYPTNGTSASVMGMGLVKNGPNQENAKALIDFVCSAEGQTALAAYQSGTLRYTNANYKVPENAWLAPSDTIKWVDRDVEYLTEHKDEILEHWNELIAKVQQ